MDAKEIERFISRQKVSFICSVDNDGFPNVKAMLMPRMRNGLKEFWFSTNTSSMRVRQYRENPRASIYFYHKGLIRYEGVMLKGTMEVLTDQAEGRYGLLQKGRHRSGLLCPEVYR